MELINLFGELKEKFKLEPAVIEDNSKDILFIGDIHGDLDTIDTIKENLNQYDKIVCLGDYVDRGVQDTKVSQEIAKLKLENDNLILLAGNHDACFEISPRDWKDRLEDKFGLKKAEEIENAYVRTFQEAPIAYINPKYKLLAIHGFIPLEKEYWSIKEWQKAKAEKTLEIELKEPAHQIVWNDPELTGQKSWNRGVPDYAFKKGYDIDGFYVGENSQSALTEKDWERIIFGNRRGSNTYVVPNELTLAFMQRNSLNTIIRSHQPQINDIFKLEKGKKIVNIGSTKAYRTQSASYVLPDDKIYPI